MEATVPHLKNGVLRRLEPEDLAAITPHLFLVDLKRHTVLSSPEAPLKNTLFVESGVISVAATSPKGKSVEILKFGREGFRGAPALLGAEQTISARVQVTGQVHTIPADVLVVFMNERPFLRAALMAYVTRCLAMSVETAFAYAVCPLRQKVARWILSTLDRIDDISFPFTHEEVARMLGARRVSSLLPCRKLKEQERSLLGVRCLPSATGTCWRNPQDFGNLGHAAGL
ncbi:CRP-like cAMP-binding protein [Shinella sp. BE166]|uniref:Crp/Fnr family transcriptional regulator n=1 Tax=Shinella sp. BE166 TaxID=3373918 RepID=UPI003EB8A5C8